MVSRGERARNDILDAAERLVAEQGVHVPLREIALAAGQRNNSAVNYYFRNRQELIDAVVKRRLEPMERERRLMLQARPADSRHDIEVPLRVMVLPLMSVDSDYYARFLQSAALHLRSDADQAPDSVWPQVLSELARAVPTTNADARQRRVGAVATTMFALLADHERRQHSDPGTAGSADEIVAMLAAMLTAPVPAARSKGRSSTPL